MRRDGLRRICELATLKLHVAEARNDAAEYARLNALSDKARVDLDLVEAQIAQHQNRHTD
jgi:hypothetical protein